MSSGHGVSYAVPNRALKFEVILCAPGVYAPGTMFPNRAAPRVSPAGDGTGWAVSLQRTSRVLEEAIRGAVTKFVASVFPISRVSLYSPPPNSEEPKRPPDMSNRAWFMPLLVAFLLVTAVIALLISRCSQSRLSVTAT